MANTSCPFPFIDAGLFPKDQGYIEGRLCGTIPLPGQKPGAECCLPCPGQAYYLHPSILTALHWNDIANVIGVGVGAFVLLSFIFLPEKVTYRSSLGISISLAAFLINCCFIFSLHDLNSVQCANAVTPADQKSNPICAFQGALHIFAGHAVALLVVCRTVYLHCQICWDLHVSRVPLIVLNVIGWLIPAIGVVVVFAVTEMTYTISNHCSLRVEWITKLLLIPIIVEIGCAVVVQFGTFIYCVNIFLRSLQEPAPPTNDSLPNSTYSGGSRYPYRKAMARITKVLRLQWRAWAQCFSLIWTGTLFSTTYFVLAEKYIALQKDLVPGKTPDPALILWVVCLLTNKGVASACDQKATFVPDQQLLVLAEFSLATCWVWVSLIFLRLSFFPEWVKLIRRTFNRIFYRPRRPARSSSQANFFFEVEEGRDPSKDYTDIKTKPLENPYRLGSLQFPKSPLAIDLHPPLATLQTDETAAILENPERPGSSQAGSISRPGTARSATLSKKEKNKKVSVEDILAMRRMEGEQGNREYPGIQPTKITRMGSNNEMNAPSPLPTYRFGEEREWPKRI